MTGLYCLDANALIQPWYNIYPKDVFSSLWPQLTNRRDKIILIKPIYDEINPISPHDNSLALDKKREKYPLRMWLEENKFPPTPLDSSVEALSLHLEQKYEIDNTPKGANGNDIKLIASAKKMKKTIVTLEKQQSEKPARKNRYKIPLICMEEKVDCIDFVELLRQFKIEM